MKQISQNYKTGAIRLEDVDPPALRRGGVLVRSEFSVISAGTELMKVREGQLSYLGKARARPDQVRKVMSSVRQHGLLATYEKVMNKLDSLTPLGYSLAGTVVAVGDGAEEFQVGQRVACGGTGYANHAEINFVPRNLVVPVPDGVSSRDAAFATVGAIAMQGYRQAALQIGESACVIGLGMLGQLLVQILSAGGVTTIGVDLAPLRCGLATRLGASAAFTPDDAELRSAVQRTSDGKGVDCVFITAGGDTNAPVELAVEIARDRARVVDIGKTRIDLSWNDYYMKELDFRFSRSYGPGRYDPVYEEGGIDYPVGYVRWTENRNMAAFLRLVSDRKVLLDPLVTAVVPFEQADETYRQLGEGGGALATLFRYCADTDVADMRLARAPVAAAGKVRLAAIGAGNYASSMLFPHLKSLSDVALVAVATATSLSGRNAARKFGFAHATTQSSDLLRAPDVDAVMITTRHSAHASMTAEALSAAKAAYVEKPLAMDLEGLQRVHSAIRQSGNDRLMVGFNRRFSQPVRDMAAHFDRISTPLVMHYRVHAGQVDRGSWYLDPAEGPRYAGEGGHFLDVFSLLARSRPVLVFAKSTRAAALLSDDLENVSVVIEYANGCVGNLLYLTQGSSRIPKEFVEVFGGGRTARLHNFESLELADEGDIKTRKYMRIDKGQRRELEEFVAAVKSGGAMPIPLQELLDTTLATIAIRESLRTGRAIRLDGDRVGFVDDERPADEQDDRVTDVLPVAGA